MVRRTVASDFGAGAHVFPGGAVDAGDSAVASTGTFAGRVIGPDYPLWAAIAAVREAYEEAGILVAGPGSDASARMVAAPFPAAGENNGSRVGFRDALTSQGLAVCLDRLRYFAHWITPEGMPRRYDTRFFLCRAIAGEEPTVDGMEVTEACWVTPRQALAEHAAGQFPLVRATQRQLQHLATFSTVADLWAWATTLREVPTVQARVEYDAAGRPTKVWFPDSADGELIDGPSVGINTRPAESAG